MIPIKNLMNLFSNSAGPELAAPNLCSVHVPGVLGAIHPHQPPRHGLWQPQQSTDHNNQESNVYLTCYVKRLYEL